MKPILLLFISSAIICSCKYVEKKTENKLVKNEYPPYIVKSFMDGCLEDNPHPDVTQTIICSCLLEKIQKKYSTEQFNEMSKLKAGKKLKEYQIFLNKSAEECIINQPKIN